MEKKKPLNLDSNDWNKIFSDKDGGPPPELVVVVPEEQQKTPQSQRDSMEHLQDHELNESIRRMRSHYHTVAPRLPDKGNKYFQSLQRYEKERDRRSLLRLQKGADDFEKSTQSQISCSSGACNDISSEVPSSQANSQALFASLFNQKLEEKPDCSITVNAFDKEVSQMGRCKRSNTRQNGPSLNKDRQKSKVPSKQMSVRCPKSSHPNEDKCRTPSGVQKFNASSSSLCHPDGNLSSYLSKRRKTSQVPNSLDSRPGKTVVLVDEEDCQPIKTTQHDNEQVGWMEEAKIYYPSRDDPECVELCSSDIECLEPEAFLSSTIMNFYIRDQFRQLVGQEVIIISSTRTSMKSLRKLYLASFRSGQSGYTLPTLQTETKLHQLPILAKDTRRSDQETFFIKFRRWWKGVNIFQKAYILLPIHESLHWSLVIICIPDKEDESGPIILHLDSLGYHASSQIFQNIKRYLIGEWNYLNKRAVPLDLPIAERIWKKLDRRIDEKIITVPQQKNDYDCGIFVLFFMERFIEEAPDRLRKKDLAMFGRQWFKPEEASGLRERIRELLLEEFQNARIENNSIESSPTSSDDAPVGCAEDNPDS